jgi:membrane-associated protein
LNEAIMDGAMQAAKAQALEWTQQYGYHAVVPALLADPAGVPWAWIFLLLLAGEAGKNVALLLGYGILVLCAWDHAGYWLGRLGAGSLVPRLKMRFPKLAAPFEQAECTVRQNLVSAVLFGRYLPLVGRWVGLGAGLAGVPYAKFALWDILGAALTSIGFGLAAHFLGRAILDAPWFPQAVLGAFVAGTLGTGAWLWWRRCRCAAPPEPQA